MFYKVCILAAGLGSRMSAITHGLSKALMPINHKAVVTHIIEKFPDEIEIVIAVGHKAQYIKDYLSCAHASRRITFVQVDNYDGPGAGPGYSLLQCRDYLQCPFIFYAVDTLVDDPIPLPDRNWLGVSPVVNPDQYCTVGVQGDLIVSLQDKINTSNKQAFIGLAGVRDYDIFFDGLASSRKHPTQEFQVSGGFSSLIGRSLKSLSFKWYDVGNPDGYSEATQAKAMSATAFDFSKPDEHIYFVNNTVIKYFENSTITKNRFLRSKQLNGLVPAVTNIHGSFYAYAKEDGQVLYAVLTTEKVSKLLDWLSSNLWVRRMLTDEDSEKFILSCYNFYRDKTIGRIDSYHKKFNAVDEATTINGEMVESLASMMARIDWSEVCNGIATNFHGDLQFDNILETVSGQFILLDWRQDFAGNIEFGDLYYDLAKLHGGMLVSYAMIKRGKFDYYLIGDSKTDIMISHNPGILVSDSRRVFLEYMRSNNFDVGKVNILTSLIFLNMAVMHHEPFAHFLYNLGKLSLQKALGPQGTSALD